MIRAKGGLRPFLIGLGAALQADLDETVKRFHKWLWERLLGAVIVVILGLTVVAVVADFGRRWVG